MGIDVLKALGTLVGMSMGGPGGAAIGAALGEGISSGGDFEKMLQAGVGTLVNTQAYGNLGLAANLLNSGTSSGGGGGGGGRPVGGGGGGQPGDNDTYGASGGVGSPDQRRAASSSFYKSYGHWPAPDELNQYLSGSYDPSGGINLTS